MSTPEVFLLTVLLSALAYVCVFFFNYDGFSPYFGLNIDQNWESIILKSKSLIDVGEINT